MSFTYLQTRPHSETMFHSCAFSKWNSYPLIQSVTPAKKEEAFNNQIKCDLKNTYSFWLVLNWKIFETYLWFCRLHRRTFHTGNSLPRSWVASLPSSHFPGAEIRPRKVQIIPSLEHKFKSTKIVLMHVEDKTLD